MKKQKKIIIVLMVSLAAGLFATTSQAFIFNWIKGAVNTVVNAVVGVVKTVVQVADTAITVIGAVPTLGINAFNQLTKGFVDVFKYQDEPGNYTVLKSVINMLDPASVKEANRKITPGEKIGTYPIPHVDKQIDYGKHFVWQKVELDPNTTGAKCANGSNYKFFVNLTPTSNNFVIFYEPGGACFDYETCKGMRSKTDQEGKIIYNEQGLVAEEVHIRDIFNPDGISDHYASLVQTALFDSKSLGKAAKAYIMNPVLTRINLVTSERIKMQNWNKIYMPYCTGDIHVGDVSHLFKRSDHHLDTSKELTVNFKGLRNTLGMLGWMRNNIRQPEQVYLTGQSAGSVGSEFHRAAINYVLKPSELYALFDSGFAYKEQPGKETKDMDLDKYPGAGTMKKIRDVWFGYLPTDTGTEMKPLSVLKQAVPDLNIHDISNAGRVISTTYPNNRVSYVVSLNDLNYSGYSYQDNPGFDEAARLDGDINVRIPKTFSTHLAEYSRQAFAKDLTWLRDQINQTNAATKQNNVGYYMPSGRRFNQSHCMTILNYDGVVMSKSKTKMVDVINNLVDRKRPAVIKEVETNIKFGLDQPLSKEHQLVEKFVPIMMHPVK